MNHTASRKRILAIAPSTRGFGYCIMEDQTILECGYKGATGDKNAHSRGKIEKLMKRYLPSTLILQDVNVKVKGCSRAPRIRILHRQLVSLAKTQKCKVVLFSGKKLRASLLGDANGTRHEMAEVLVKKFPELAAKLPPKRRAWESENRRMDLFDAVGLAVVFW
jgi:hypothetical protein